MVECSYAILEQIKVHTLAVLIFSFKILNMENSLAHF